MSTSKEYGQTDQQPSESGSSNGVTFTQPFGGQVVSAIDGRQTHCREPLSQLCRMVVDPDRVTSIERCSAMKLDRESPLDAAQLSAAPTTPPVAFTTNFPIDKVKKAFDGKLPFRSIALGLAARFAPDSSPSTCPPTEVPIRTFQLGHPSVPWTDTDPFISYCDWLSENFTGSGLTRCAEFAWIRACERGTAPELKHDRNQVLRLLYEYFNPIVISHKPRDPNWDDAVSKAWAEFQDSYLASNTEVIVRPLRLWLHKTLSDYPGDHDISSAIAGVSAFDVTCLNSDDETKSQIRKIVRSAGERISPELATALSGELDQSLDRLSSNLQQRKGESRDRYAAIGSFSGFLIAWAKKRMPRPSFALTHAAHSNMQRDGLPEDIAQRLEPLIGLIWRTKAQCLARIEGAIGNAELTRHKKLIICSLELLGPDGLPLQNSSTQQNLPATEPLEKSRYLVALALLENELPRGEYIQAEVGEMTFVSILKSTEHWESCRHIGRWGDPPPLSDAEKARLHQYVVNAKPASDVAELFNLTRAGAHLSLFNAIRKIRCCLATSLSPEFFEQARSLLNRYLLMSRLWISDRDAYTSLAESLGMKPFPLPGGGLLATVLFRKQAKKVCQAETGSDEIAVDYHCNAMTVNELAKRHSSNRIFHNVAAGSHYTDEVERFLQDHWLKVISRVEAALQPTDSLETGA